MACIGLENNLRPVLDLKIFQKNFWLVLALVLIDLLHLNFC